MPDLRHLTAVSRLLEPGPPIDPFALAGNQGVVVANDDRTIVGLGTAAVCSAGDTPDRLAGVTCLDMVERPGSGVIALGALPFQPASESRLIVPRWTYVRDEDGVEWVTTVGGTALAESTIGLRNLLLQMMADRSTDRRPDPDDDQSTTGGASADDPSAAGHSTLLGGSPVPLPSEETFVDSVAAAIATIKAGRLRKVVLARHLEIDVDRQLSVADVLRRFRRLEPTCTAFSFPTPSGRFVGATPELLVSRRGAEARCQPLAGTGGTTAEDAARLLGSAKDAEEHQLVVSAIEQVLAPWCAELHVPDRPGIIQLRSVTHLGTTITGRLRGDAQHRPDVLALVGALHPTPAVGGTPVASAMALIGELEPFDRGNFAGPVGWTDAGGDGDWYLGIRSFSMRGGKARVSAGVGIVAGSDPLQELAETTVKLDSILAALRPEAAVLTG